jgi:hypothetical protein
VLLCLFFLVGVLAPSPKSGTLTLTRRRFGRPSRWAEPAPAGGCTPLTDGGKCYEPGEFCRKSDREAHGVVGDGKAIVCEDNDGLRWEPA